MDKTSHIPFNKPHMAGDELRYITEAHANGHLSGNGAFTKKCQAWLAKEIGASATLLTHSCTAALEMAAILADIGPQDEVIMPSFTFVSTANAFVLRGGVPVFVDIRPDTLNLDEQQIESAITDRTRAIVVVHYAGIGCEMDAIMEIAARYELLVIEDAAQAVHSDYRGRALGGIGDFGTVSFHETKNVNSGEGGALIVNDPSYLERAEIIWEKGTNRSQFHRGQVDKYTWTDIGSSYLPSELIAAFLWAQLEAAAETTQRRLDIWARYDAAFKDIAPEAGALTPFIPDYSTHNAHIYYLILKDLAARQAFISYLAERGVQAVFHYVPLHSSPAGKHYARAHGNLSVTDSISDQLVRLPLWPDMTASEIDRVISVVTDALRDQ